ncbi:MAG TPA: SCO family protein [Steroidobacteraceae bacterium]
MTFRTKLLSCAFLCVLAAAAIASIIWWPKPPAVLATGTILAPARTLANFSLIDNQGRSFGEQNLRGHWSLMFFGYTNCPGYCPTTLTTLAALEKQLRAAKKPAPPQVIFVSVDAKRDTPERLNQFVPNFDPEFVGLTAASQPAIEALAKKWGVAVNIQYAANGNYIVDHSTVIFVIDPAGHLAAVLTGPFTVDALRDDYQRIVTAGV